MATCRMFYQDNKTTSAINPNNHARNQSQHKVSLGATDTRTTDEINNPSLLIGKDEEHPSTPMQVETTSSSSSNASKNTNGKLSKQCDDGNGMPLSIDESNIGDGDGNGSVLTPKRKTSSEGGCLDENDGGSQNRTNRRSLSSSFVTEEEDIEDDIDPDNSESFTSGNRKHDAKGGDSPLAPKSSAPSTSYYNNSTNTRSLNRNSEGEVAFNNSSNVLENDADDNRHHKHNSLTSEQLAASTKEELIQAYNQLQAFIDIRNNNYEDEISQLKSSIEKYRTRQVEASRRENILIMKLRTKEQEMEDYVAQIDELKAAVVPTTGVLKTSLIDPSVNFIMLNMKKELQETKKKLQDAQDDLVAWKFTPDSNTGKRLMAKCKMLYVENEELGKMINGGRVAKLENDIALQKNLTEDLRKSQTDMVDLVHELDEDVEGMQSTIFYLQQQLRERNKDGDPNPSANHSPLPTESTSGIDATKCLISLSELCSMCRTRNSETINLRTTRTKPPATEHMEEQKQSDHSPKPTPLDSVGGDDNAASAESNQRTHLVNGLICSDPDHPEDDNSLSTSNNQSVLKTTTNCSVADESMETSECDENNANANAITTKTQLLKVTEIDTKLTLTNSTAATTAQSDQLEPDADEQPFKKSKLSHPQPQSDESSNNAVTVVEPMPSEGQRSDEVPSSSSFNGSGE